MVEKTAAAEVTRKRRLYEIDLLRFVAALMVVLFHFSFSLGQSKIDYAPTLGPVTRYGYLGVDLFFMISGMVVFMSLSGRTPRQFLISRVSRLYPAYWVAVTLTTLSVVLIGARGRHGIGPVQYLANLTMFPQAANVPYVEGVYWTLWSEWRFYALLFAFALVGITTRRTHWFMWGWLAVSATLEVLPLPARATSALALAVQPLYSHYFIAGMALYLIYRAGATRNLVALLFACYANAVYEGVRNADTRAAANVELNPIVVAAVITAIFVVMTLVATGAFTRWSRPGLATVGLMTYPLYLIHPTIGFAILNAGAPTLDRWMLLAITIVALCLLSWVISTQVEARLQPLMRTTLTNRFREKTAARHRLRATEPTIVRQQHKAEPDATRRGR